MDETTLEEKYKRILLILKVRNQIIKAQKNTIERLEEELRQLKLWERSDERLVETKPLGS
jgi:hypothetical protein